MPESQHDTARIVGRVIATFAYQHMKAAVTFRDHVIAIERANLGAPFGGFFEDIRSHGSGCIMSAAASLEAHINECFINPHGPLRQMLPDFEVDFWGQADKRGIEQKPPLVKYQKALEMLGHERLDEHSPTFRNTWALYELRNALVHYKPTWDPDRKRKVEMIEVLQGKFALSPFPDGGADFVTMRCMGADCMQWVIATCMAFLREFHGRANIEEKKMSAFWKLDD